MTQGVIEDVEEASPQEAQHERRPLQRTQIDTITFDKFSHGVIILGLIMYYFYICDYVHFFPKASRTYSRDLFIVLMLLLFVVATSLAVKENGKRLLNRDQTEEWKGWMQVMFVWYHYFKAAEIYNAIRIFIAAYVWMTGFGRCSFGLPCVFYLLFSHNYSVGRCCSFFMEWAAHISACRIFIY